MQACNNQPKLKTYTSKMKLFFFISFSLNISFFLFVAMRAYIVLAANMLEDN